MTPTDEAREALLSYGEQLNASDRTWFKNDVDALIAAVRAEVDCGPCYVWHRFEHPGAESAQELAALRSAAANVSDRRTLMDDGFWVSQKEMRALDATLAATPVERLYPDPRPVVERGGIAATPAEGRVGAFDQFDDYRDAATPAEDEEGRT